MADGEGNEIHPSSVSSKGRNEGEYFSVFFSILMSQLRSLKKPISKLKRVNCFLSKEVGSGEGASWIPLV